MHEENLYEEYPHYISQAITSITKKERKNINLTFLGGKYYKYDDFYSHRISLATSGKEEKQKLENLGFNIRTSKDDNWRIETERKEYDHAEYFARMIDFLTDGYNIVRKIKLTQDTYKFMPIGSLRESMVVVVNDNGILKEEKIIKIEKEYIDEYVYDINIKDTRNYFANDICVHNCIYSWRGANFKNILNFEKDYKDAEVILLEQNYRSTKNILNAANSVIKNNIKRKDKNLWTENEEGEKIKYVRTNDEKDESSFVTREIKNLKEQGISLSDIAVLYRTNAQSRTIEEAFLNSNIPYTIVGSFAFYSRKEIKDLT